MDGNILTELLANDVIISTRTAHNFKKVRKCIRTLSRNQLIAAGIFVAFELMLIQQEKRITKLEKELVPSNTTEEREA